MGQSVTRAISVYGRQPRRQQPPPIYTGFFCQRRGGSVLNITSAEVLPTRCGDREEEDRENRKRRRRRPRDEEGSQDRNHRLAFFSGFKHPLHQPPPDRPRLYPLPPWAQRDVRARAFPLSVSQRMHRMRFYPRPPSTLSEDSVRFPALLCHRVSPRAAPNQLTRGRARAALV